MERNLGQLLRTKRYRALQKLYGKVSDPIHALEKKEVLSDEETQKPVSYTHLPEIQEAENQGGTVFEFLTNSVMQGVYNELADRILADA